MTIKILVLAANPIDTVRLRLDKEVREITNGLQRANKRDEFSLVQQWAARPIDLRRALLEHEPEILHFCGHGEGTQGLFLENDQGNATLVSTDALANFARLFSNHVKCIVLNACYSAIQAEALAQHISYVVGMSGEISDEAAIEFSVAFYDSLGAGKSYLFAFELACNAIQLLGIEGYLIPRLHKKLILEESLDTSALASPTDEEELYSNELAFFREADLLMQIKNIQRSITSLERTIQHLPVADVPATRLIEIDELKERLSTYNLELQRRSKQ